MKKGVCWDRVVWQFVLFVYSCGKGTILWSEFLNLSSSITDVVASISRWCSYVSSVISIQLISRILHFTVLLPESQSSSVPVLDFNLKFLSLDCNLLLTILSTNYVTKCPLSQFSYHPCNILSKWASLIRSKFTWYSYLIKLAD